MATSFVIDRKDLRAAHWTPSPDEELAANQVRLAVRSIALTANNITYAQFGDRMNYWDVFPAPSGFGHVPTWGFAEVVETKSAALRQGDRLYGLFTLSSQLTLELEPSTGLDLLERSAHRSHLSPFYNSYRKVSVDPSIARSGEGLYALFYPLFLTAFLIKDMIDDKQFEADVVVLTSASSKTALALAHVIKASAGPRPKIIGLTSADNAAFARESGVYDEILRYEDIAALPEARTVLIDMAGNAALRAAIHGHLGSALQYSAAVGGTHREALGSAHVPDGPRPQLFFAPARLAKRHADWGQAAFERNFAPSWQGFLDSLDSWFRVETVEGRDPIAQLYHDTLEGRSDHRCGKIANLQTV